MLKAKDKEARRGNLITFAIVLALTLVTMVLENVISPGSLLFTVIKKGAVYSLVAVSMNLLNGFTGLFSLGQAGFMLLGAYAYAIFMIPDAARDGVYYLFEGSSIHFSFQEMFQHLFGATGFGGGVSLVLGVLVAIIFAGLIAAFFAYLIGLPVLRLRATIWPSPRSALPRSCAPFSSGRRLARSQTVPTSSRAIRRLRISTSRMLPARYSSA